MNESKAVSIISISAILVGALLNPLFLGFVFSPTGKILSMSTILFVIIVEVLVIAFGVWAYTRRDHITRRGLLLRGIVVSLVLLSTEVGLHVAKHALDYFRRVPMDNRLNLSFYRDAPWTEQAFKEYREVKLDFDQYLVWKTKEYHGTYVNVDAQGTRKTVSWETSAGPADSVFVFGGSSIWGAYVRDENTVPSQLSRRLKEQGRTSIVYNFAVPGYSYNQELLRLILLLKDGRRPRVVIFCDGFNDIIAAHRTGVAGRIGLYDELKSAVETKRLPYRMQLALLGADFLEKQSMLYKSVDRLAILLFKTNGGRKYDQQQLKDLSTSIVRDYTASCSLLDSLSHVYGFTLRCFLQPVIYTKEYLSEEERTLDPLVNDPEMRELYLSTYASLEHLNLPHWFTLSHVFDGQRDSFFSDLCHLSEAGNQFVADEIMKRTFEQESHR